MTAGGKRGPRTFNTSSTTHGASTTSTSNNANDRRSVGKAHTGGRSNGNTSSSSGANNILNNHYSAMVDVYDRLHNGSVPCCSCLRDIVQKIFPESKGRGKNDDHVISTSQSLSGVMPPQQNAVVPSQNNTKVPSSHNKSMLHLLVRKYLLEERWERRQNVDQREYNQDQHTGGDTDDNDAMKHYLDSILLDWNENGSHHDNNNLPSENLTTVDMTLAPHRSLQSFFEYIQKCSEEMATVSKEEHATTGHRKRSSRQKGKTIAGPSSLTSSWMPPIPLSMVMNMVVRINCRYCQGECIDYLKTLGRLKLQSDGLLDDWTERGLFLVAMGTEEQEEDGDQDKGKYTTTPNQANDTTSDFKIITSIQLDKCSIQGDKKKGREKSYDGSYWDRNDVEYAFDYNLLEEGGIALEEDKANIQHDEDERTGLWFDLVQDQNSSNKFLQLKRSSINNSNSVLASEDLENWIKDVVIPCGMTGKWPLGVSEDDIQLLSQRIDFSLSDFIQTIKDEIPRTLLDARKALVDAEESLKTPGAFNVKAGKALKECDEHQNAFMGHCRKLLVELDRLTVHLRRHRHPYQKWATKIMDELWDSYMSCLLTLIDPSMRFLWEGIQLDVNRTGSVPLHFNSPQQRENLKEMLKKRFTVISRLQESIENKMLARVEGGDENSTNLRRLLALSHFFSLYQEDTTDLSETKTAIGLMLETRDKVIFEVIYNTNVNKILNAQDTRCNNLYDEISRTYTMVRDAIKEITMNRKDELTWQTNTIIIEESQIEFDLLHTTHSEPSLEKDIQRVRVLCEFTKNVLQQYRFLQQLEISNVKDVKTIPGDIIDMCFGTSPAQSCKGGYGKRRLVGILSSCVYRWLEEKCIEWHAEVTHQELMIETENELLREQIQCNHQKKKSKKKKRKRKNTNHASPEESKDELASSKQLDYSSEERMTSQDSTLNRNKTHTTETSSRPNQSNITEGKGIESKENVDSPTTTKISDGKTVIDSISSSKFVQELSNEENVQVFVSDQQGNLVSVENFLCSRYFNVLEKSEIEERDDE